ncbi:hypothetical protein ACFWY9_39655 [Amycolatopsis sp. NPDC059027]|uniref:hypothetical protein n=1 Tax=unclassified Amycolatopsis TaxID=2618356 RepID=UPI00366E3E98
MASPDTEELTSAPLPVGPETESPRAEPPPRDDAEDAGLAAAGGDGGRGKESGRWWRGLTGSLAAGLVVLALGVLAVAGVCLFTGAPGPAVPMLAGHPVAALLAVLGQRVADRRNGLVAGLAGVGVLAVVAATLILFWLN